MGLTPLDVRPHGLQQLHRRPDRVSMVTKTEPGPIVTFFTALATALGGGYEIGNLNDDTQGTFGQMSWVATPFDDCGEPAIVTRTQR